MPRKPSTGPAIMRIEGLSSGRDPTLRDDFTGEVLAQPNARPTSLEPQAELNASNRRKREAKRVFLETVGILPSKPKPRLVAPSIAGMRAIRVNDQFAIYVERKPWRRV